MDVVLYFNRAINQEKLAGVLEIAKKAHTHVQVINDIPTKARIRSLCSFWNPKGIIVECSGCGAGISSKDFGTLPVVFFNRSFRDLSEHDYAISHDSCGSGELAARELMMSDCENFAYIPDPGNAFWSREREQGFRRALELNGRRYTPFAGKLHATDVTKRNSMLQAFLKKIAKPCAVFAANDAMAAEVITAARLVQLSIPDEIAVLGVDNNPGICEHTNPTLSSIEPDFRLGGNLAMLMLLAIIRDKKRLRGARQRTFGDTHVVRRLSTKWLQRSDPTVKAALDYIRQHACEGLTAADVVRRFPCSRRMADIRFRQAVGHTILDEIHAIRLDRAKALLNNPHLELKSISDFCGFRNPNSLRKFFRKETGLSMSAWRMARTNHSRF